MKNDRINEYSMCGFLFVPFYYCLSLGDIVNVCMKAIIIIVHSARKTDQCINNIIHVRLLQSSSIDEQGLVL